jgi:hypothetical protein
VSLRLREVPGRPRPGARGRPRRHASRLRPRGPCTGCAIHGDASPHRPAHRGIVVRRRLRRHAHRLPEPRIPRLSGRQDRTTRREIGSSVRPRLRLRVPGGARRRPARSRAAELRRGCRRGARGRLSSSRPRPGYSPTRPPAGPPPDRRPRLGGSRPGVRYGAGGPPRLAVRRSTGSRRRGGPALTGWARGPVAHVRPAPVPPGPA